MAKRLHKSATERMIAGVCGGLAEYFDVDPVLMRLAFVLLVFLTGVGILLYPLLWIIMPEQGSLERPPREVVRENLDRMREDVERMGESLRAAPHEPSAAAEGPEAGAAPSEQDESVIARAHSSGDRQFILGAVVLLIGLLLLLQNLGLFWWASFWRLWPLVLVALGVYLLYQQSRARR